MRKSWWWTLPIVLVALYFGINLYAERRVQKEVDNAIAEMSSFADVQYEDVDFDLFSRKASIKGVVISPVGEERRLSIDRVVVLKAKGEKTFFTRLHILFMGVRVESGEAGEKVAAFLDDLGYEPEEMKADIELDYRFKPEERDFRLKTLTYRVKNMGEISLSLHLSNIDLRDDALSLLLSFPRILIHEAKLSYRDDSLVPRLLRAMAEKRGISVDSMIKEITAEVERGISEEGEQIAAEALEAFRKFLEDPEEISLIISPKNPLPLARIKRARDPAQLLRILNFRIET